MKIAVTAAGEGLTSPVFGEFAQTPFLLLVDMDTMECVSIPHSPAPDSDQDLARMILEHRCEAVITGKLEKKAFDMLADEAVTRYSGTGMTAAYALDAMESRELDLIRNAAGTDACESNHGGLEDHRECSSNHIH